MKLHLVRHARGVSRSDWRDRGLPRGSAGEAAESAEVSSPDPTASGEPNEADLFELLRPLSEAGYTQAKALAQHLLEDPPQRLLSSPALRCQQTLEPLALALGLPVEVDDRLGDDEPLSGVASLVADLGDTPAVVSTHAGPIRALLELLELAGDLDPSGPTCRKGALWTLKGPGGFDVARATYVEPTRTGELASSSSLRRELPRPRSVRAAVLDMGSTSFTLLIADVTRDGEIRPVVREKVMLRLGAAIAKGGKIPSSMVRRAVEVATELHRIALPEKVEHFLPVATAALRDAPNGRKIAEQIARAIGEPVRILDGEDEARLMFSAFQHRLALGGERVLGLDLGGGSLELAVGCGEHIDGACTLRLGVVRLHGELVRSDPMRPREARRVREQVHRSLAEHRDDLVRQLPERMIVTGGTPRAIARLVASERGSSTGADALPLDVGLKELRAMAKRLVRSSLEERVDMPGIRRSRADLVATGALILVCVAESLGLDHFTFCDWGLREGVLLEFVSSSELRVVADA